MNNKRDLRPEYPAELIKSGIRGKYAARYRSEGTNVVPIDPDLNATFPSVDEVRGGLIVVRYTP